MTPPWNLCLCSLVLLVACTGCAVQSYSPKPLNAQRSAAEYATRSTDDGGLKGYMVSHGVAQAPWPPARWGLQELTLLAFYFHPDLALARAQVNAARAMVDIAQTPSILGLTPRVEHHSEHLTSDHGPWSLGFELEIPIARTSRRAAILEGERLALEQAQLHVAQVAWQIRMRVRASLLDLYAAQRGLELTVKESTQNEALVKLLQRRLQEGMASTLEVTGARLRSTQANADAQTFKLAGERAMGELASALGMPLELVRTLPLAFTDFDALPLAPETRATRAQALLNRIDIRTQLLSYARAESAVKLQVARQYPELKLSPGFLWDRGDAVWSLGLGMAIPAVLGNAPEIRLASAQREVEARQFEQLQTQVLSESAARLAVYRQAVAGASAIDGQLALEQQRLNETEKLFASGYADRLALVQSRLESLGASKTAWSARRAALDALGELENVMQVPLVGSPLPRTDREEARP